MALHAAAVRPICAAISSYSQPSSTIFVSLLLSAWLQQYSARLFGTWPNAACVSRGLLAGFRDGILRFRGRHHQMICERDSLSVSGDTVSTVKPR
jgi:hypothetical protein